MEAWPIPVAEILGEHGASVSAEGDFAIPELVVGEETFAMRAPAHFRVEITNSGSGLVGMGHVSAPVVASCSRCLCDFDTQIDADVEGFWIEPGQEEGVPEEQEIQYVRPDESVDIYPALIEALTLEAPFAPLHAEECAGICPTCGKDLNQGACDCAEPPAQDHPFAKLAELFPEPREEEPEQR